MKSPIYIEEEYFSVEVNLLYNTLCFYFEKKKAIATEMLGLQLIHLEGYIPFSFLDFSLISLKIFDNIFCCKASVVICNISICIYSYNLLTPAFLFFFCITCQFCTFISFLFLI